MWPKAPWCVCLTSYVNFASAQGTCLVRLLEANGGTAPRSTALGSEWRRSTLFTAGVLHVHGEMVGGTCKKREAWTLSRGFDVTWLHSSLLQLSKNHWTPLQKHVCIALHGNPMCWELFNEFKHVLHTMKTKKKTKLGSGHSARQRTTAPELFPNGHRSCILQTRIKHGCNSHATANTCEAAFPTCQIFYSGSDSQKKRAPLFATRKWPPYHMIHVRTPRVGRDVREIRTLEPLNTSYV